MITSVKSRYAKHIAGLLQKARFRREEGLFVCEGARLVSEIPPELLHSVYYTPAYARKYGIPGAPESIEISGEVLKKISGVDTPQGIMAIAKQPVYDSQRLFEDAGSENKLIIFLERIQDPGNMGTIIRTAEAAGADGIVMSRDCVDVFSPKVVRSTMGSIFRMPLAVQEDFTGALERAKAAGITVFACALDKEARPYYNCDFTASCGILIGNEGSGLSKEAIAAAGEKLYIPMAGSLESLNAAMACGIVAFEAARQRLKEYSD